MIPKQIEKFNFVLIGQEKKPFEKAWQKKIHRIDCPEFQKHIEEGKNYGVQSNNSSVVIDDKTHFLVIVDFDTKEAQDKVIGRFPETFTTSSGSPKNCCHLWLASDDNKAFKTKDENSDTLAELLGAGNQVIAPGSEHPSGSTYEVTKDIPIAFMPYAEIEAILKPLDKSPKKIKKIKKDFIPKGISDDINSTIFSRVSMESILNELGIDTSKNPTECYFHNSSGGQCMGWDNETAHCFHCDNSWNKFSLIREAKNFTDKDTFDWFAEKSGMTEELKKSRKEYAEKKKKEKIEEESGEEIQDFGEGLKGEYLSFVRDKKWNDASELVVNYIKENNYIYTTKIDDKNEMWIYKDGIYIPQGKSQVKELMRELLDKWYSAFSYNQVMNKLEVDTFIEVDEFFNQNHIWEIPVENGILNLETKQLGEFDPTKIFFNKLQVKYNPKATCPKIDSFLSETLSTEDDTKVFYELGGFSLLKEYRFEKAFMLIGDGRNGKDKCLELIKRLIGIENCCSVPLASLMPDSFIISSFFGKMVNIAGEINNKDLKETSCFKALTGRSLVSAPRKFLNPITFQNYAKFIFACNELPMVYDNSRGFWDRWILLEFPYTFVTQKEINETEDKTNLKLRNENIIEEITIPEEMEGLLNKFLEGLDRLLEKRNFSTTKGCQEIKDLWIRKSNSFMAFCLDHIESDYNQYITKKEMRKQYHVFCKKHKIITKTDYVIKRTLEEMFGSIEGRKLILNTQEPVWEGIKFKE